MNLSDTLKLKELQKQARREKGIIRRAKRKQEKAQVTNAGWQVFKGQELPQSALDWIERYQNDSNAKHGHNCQIFSNFNSWVLKYVYFKGPNPETATEWIITTNDGGYYKVGAMAMVWYRNINGNTGSAAEWSIKNTKLCIKQICLAQPVTRDPNYQS